MTKTERRPLVAMTIRYGTSRSREQGFVFFRSENAVLTEQLVVLASEPLQSHCPNSVLLLQDTVDVAKWA